MDYKEKLITLEQALELVKSNYNIVTGLGATEPQDFMNNLHTIGDRVKNVTITNCLPMNHGEFLKPEYKESFNIDGWFYSPTLRKAHLNGNISYIPNHLHLAGIKRLAHMKPNIYAGSASMPDKHGFISLSLSNTYEKRMMEEADIIILEVNPNYPRTFGDVEVHYSDIDYLIASNYEVPALPDVVSNEKDIIIGNLIAEYINDGDCIQLGIGGIPNAVTDALMTKKDLGVHTEMMTSGMVKLAQAGVINGKKKNLHKGKIVCTFALGNKELYEFLDDNTSVMFLDGNYVNDPYVIAQNDNMVSINTSIEVDLTGQCCSESIGPIQFSGTGGQSDTAVGAQKSKNGKSFIALYSTAMVKNKETGEREEISKIVPMLKQGAYVTLSRNDVDYVVTEYGVVSLRGTNIKERVERLISIAHPKFRDELLEEAHKIGLIYDI
ncbi:acetyl-CoA hydrolase/transferase C-terminal domain-containing protein [Tissierella sp.]|uniref:acetyl-CoA hydrolase/transferase family protein n=1 Tax=Tissierella sp. TaxID=41274 RepID=UPI002866C6ED|nr:acetyl-CoA hydrolase/transferase C-terminal domain-containing protein [Tissierella sp.]MDR7857444.1 acetyl-CoA hydrolase/transferase C-terminal domain-containing protein [Tissierella sp.]